MLPILAALTVAVGCDLEKPSGGRGCDRQAVDALRMNQIQALGTHNSYKQAIAPAEMAIIAAATPKDAKGLDYAHPPLTAQLNAGARAIELDIVSDPQGGRYADPMGLRLAAKFGRPTLAYDAAPMRKPGLKVFHIQDFDYRSNCALFVDCLKEMRAWSLAHPDHLPILVTMNLKDDDVKVAGTVHALKFDAAAMDGIDAEILSVFAPGELVVPDDVRGGYRTLREGARADNWPTLAVARGRFMFCMDEDDAKSEIYRGKRRSLEGRVLFVNVAESSPMAGYITLNEPIKQRARIRADVIAGYVVRTRADADTVEARSNDTKRRRAAFASGAQYVSTDYMSPDLRFSDYSVTLPGGGVGRVNPVTAAGKR